MKKAFKIFMAFIFIGLTSCSDEDSNPAAGLNSLVNLSDEPSGANCEFGGVKVEVGLDTNQNEILDQDEITSTQFICNGSDGTDGIDGEDGADGTDGENGEDGSNGEDGLNSLINLMEEPAGSECISGGYRIEVGLDLNRNDILDNDEITNTSFICNGSNGTNGLNSLIAITDEPSGDNCTTGGYRIEVGIDSNENGELDPEEVTDVAYICFAGEDEEQPSDFFKPTDSDALIAYYPFDGTLEDASTNELDGSSFSAMFDLDRNGNAARALRLSGSSDQVVTTPDIPLNAGSFTLSFWIYVNSSDYLSEFPNLVRYIMSSRAVCGEGKLFGTQYIHNSTGGARFFGVEARNGTGASYGNQEDAFPVDQWIHIAATIDNDTKRTTIYYNGVSVGFNIWEGVEADVSNTEIFRIGTSVCVAGSNAEPFIGLVDEVAIFSTVLTESEILGLAEVE